MKKILLLLLFTTSANAQNSDWSYSNPILTIGTTNYTAVGNYASTLQTQFDYNNDCYCSGINTGFLASPGDTYISGNPNNIGISRYRNFQGSVFSPANRETYGSWYSLTGLFLMIGDIAYSSTGHHIPPGRYTHYNGPTFVIGNDGVITDIEIDMFVTHTLSWNVDNTGQKTTRATIYSHISHGQWDSYWTASDNVEFFYNEELTESLGNTVLAFDQGNNLYWYYPFLNGVFQGRTRDFQAALTSAGNPTLSGSTTIMEETTETPSYYEIPRAFENILRRIPTSLNPPNNDPVDRGSADGRISYEDAGRLRQLNFSNGEINFSTLDLSMFRNLVAINIQSQPRLRQIIFPDHDNEWWDFRVFGNDLRTLDLRDINLLDNPNTFGLTGNYNLSTVYVRDLNQARSLRLPDRFATYFRGTRTINSLPYRYTITVRGRTINFLLTTD